MNKKITVLLALLALISIVAVPVLAMTADSPSADNGLSKGTNNHLYLAEKNTETWDIIEESSWGKLNINIKQNHFVFNGHGLTPDVSYELICYLDPWPAEDSLSLGVGVADEEGNVHIEGEIDVGELPIGDDTEGNSIGGSKIRLVLDDDFDGSQMTAWNPEEYLFEYDLLNKQD